VRRRSALEALRENGDRQSGRLSGQQVHVVGFAVELDQLDIEVGKYAPRGVLGSW
jgi:hypothetical protein